MQQQLDNLRLRVGLAHAIPGAELRVRRNDGAEFVAANRPLADMDLCRLRHAVMASSCPSSPNITRWFECLGISGSLAEDESGIFHDQSGLGAWWFATLIRQDRVLTLLEQLDNDDVDNDSVQVFLKPDPGLGMTSVGIVTTQAGSEVRLAALATDVYQACLVEELICVSRSSRIANTSPRGEGTATGLDHQHLRSPFE